MNSLSRQIVFIPGLSISNNSWDKWGRYFTILGYECFTPAWPNKEADPQTLRNEHPYSEIATLSLSTVVSHFTNYLKSLSSKPILIGHSIGGLIVQILVDKELAIAGIMVHSFPPPTVFSSNLFYLKDCWHMLFPFSSASKTYLVPFQRWCTHFTNTFEYQFQKESYYEYATPESKKIVRDTWRCKFAIDYQKPHAPLLFIGGSKDKLIPALLNQHTQKLYLDTNSVCSFVMGIDQCHLSFLSSDWKTEADYTLEWLATFI